MDDARLQDAPAWTGLQHTLRAAPRSWLVTGAAGFIGSHLLETLLRLDQHVVALDNFATGFQRNLDEVLAAVEPAQAARCDFVAGDLRDPAACARACRYRGTGSVDHVLHQAALGSVPRSLRDPFATHDNNVTGFLTLLIAARDAGVRSLVYASSSSVYGDHPALPKVEPAIGNALSPYAVSKRSNELYADVFARSYGMQLTGLRYFNVFGARQDPDGPYAAVIPAWTAAMLRDETVWVNGDGETSRDFCHVANVVQANLLAAQPLAPEATATPAGARVFNVAVGERSTLNDLIRALVQALHAEGHPVTPRVTHREFRPGDVRHSLADIGSIRSELGYQPTQTLQSGISLTMPWYLRSLG